MTFTITQTLSSCPSVLQNVQINIPAILKACQEGKLATVQKLLSHASTVLLNTPYQGDYFLHQAVSHGHLEVATFLINKGADPLCKDAQGLTAYDYAALRTDSKQIFPALLAISIDKNIKACDTLLQNPSKLSQVQQAQQKIKASLNTKLPIENLLKAHKENNFYFQGKPLIKAPLDAQGNTLLHFAAARGDHACIKFAMKQNINLATFTNKDGQTPLHFACAMESPCMKELIADAKSDIHHKDQAGITPLMFIGASARERDPLHLSRIQTWLTVITAAEWLCHTALKTEMAHYLSDELTLLLDISSLCKFMGEFYAARDGWSTAGAMLCALSLIFLPAIMYVFETDMTLPVNLVVIAQTACVARSAFKQINAAWKNRSLNPCKALKKAAFSGFNLLNYSNRLLKIIDKCYKDYLVMDAREQLAEASDGINRCEDKYQKCQGTNLENNCKSYWTSRKCAETKAQCQEQAKRCRSIWERVQQKAQNEINHIVNAPAFSWLFSGFSAPTAAENAPNPTSTPSTPTPASGGEIDMPDLSLDPTNRIEAKEILAPNGLFNNGAYRTNKKTYIRKLIKPLLLKFHPDKCKAKDQGLCTAIMQKINVATETLLA